MFNKRKLPMRVAFLTLLVFVAICAGGYCYQTLHTPEYALEQTRKAIRERDKDLLERYVDIDSIISSGYDEGAAVLTENIINLNERYPQDPFFWHDAAFMRDYTREHRRESLAFIHDIIIRYLTRNTVEMNFEQDPTGSLAHELEIFQSEVTPEILSIENDGNRALISLVLHGTDTPYGQLVNDMPFVFELLRQSNGDWKIVRIANPKDLLWPITNAAETYWTMQGWQN